LLTVTHLFRKVQWARISSVNFIRIRKTISGMACKFVLSVDLEHPPP